jgi:hypothetical protein
MADPRTIYQFYDTAFECPQCGRRLDFGDAVDEDEDGPIYEGECLVHGTMLVQSANEDTDEDDA